MDHKRRHGAETVESRSDYTDLEESCDGRAGIALQPAVRVEDIIEAYRPLAKPWKTWIQSDIESAIPVLSKRLNFIAGGCSSESVSLCKSEYQRAQLLTDHSCDASYDCRGGVH